jgi:DNA processing protein
LVVASRTQRVADPNHPFVVAALLSAGVDTRACRLVASLLNEERLIRAADLPDRVAHMLWPDPTQRAKRLERARLEAIRALERSAQAGYQTLTLLDSVYPAWLRQITDPPPVLWVRGELTAGQAAPAVAIVGARRAGAGGVAIARRLATDLSHAGVTIVSGLARGIDAAAHAGALDGPSPTWAVLGSGLDVIYPPEHRGLAERVARQGAVLSELPPGSPPIARHFPLRNRIISGLSRAVVVVEASDKSGSLITARTALDQGRDVLAVPGTILSGCHRGCHALIKDGARLVETVGDILDEIGWRRPARQVSDKPCISKGLLAVLPVGELVGLEELSARTGRSASNLLVELTDLEMAGTVARAPGGLFQRLD